MVHLLTAICLLAPTATELPHLAQMRDAIEKRGFYAVAQPRIKNGSGVFIAYQRADETRLRFSLTPEKHTRGRVVTLLTASRRPPALTLTNDLQGDFATVKNLNTQSIAATGSAGTVTAMINYEPLGPQEGVNQSSANRLEDARLLEALARLMMWSDGLTVVGKARFAAEMKENGYAISQAEFGSWMVAESATETIRLPLGSQIAYFKSGKKIHLSAPIGLSKGQVLPKSLASELH